VERRKSRRFISRPFSLEFCRQCTTDVKQETAAPTAANRRMIFEARPAE
jgi:hypothetical protein